jgi:hypothetical protein
MLDVSILFLVIAGILNTVLVWNIARSGLGNYMANSYNRFFNQANAKFNRLDEKASKMTYNNKSRYGRHDDVELHQNPAQNGR